ncbi:tyrosine-type recombinase/integrase [Pedobacter sp. MR2016-24]|nr:tyrosine-type recombinase/integrase [Pedobacter sp. MR2016-24]
MENKEKYTYTRLYLCGLLLYENNIRLSEQVLIRLKDISLERGHISILNKKNDSIRTVLMSEKVNELITIICNNTLNKGISLSDEMYLFGGHNILKFGKPHSYKELGTLMRRFRQQYPQFVNITLYEQKHTSITNQFDDGIDHYVIKERANHSSIATTEIYLQSNRAVKPYELKERKTV